jgi:hypothetical protein
MLSKSVLILLILIIVIKKCSLLEEFLFFYSLYCKHDEFKIDGKQLVANIFRVTVMMMINEYAFLVLSFACYISTPIIIRYVQINIFFRNEIAYQS